MGDFVKDAASVAFVAGAFITFGPAGGLAASAAVLGASATVKSAGAQEVQLKLAQRQEEQAAKERELARQERLVTVLGTQKAAAAASGVAFSGSVANVSITDAERAATDRLVDRSNTRITIRGLKAQASSISRAGALKAGATLLQTGASLTEGVTFGKKTTTKTKPSKSTKRFR